MIKSVTLRLNGAPLPCDVPPDRQPFAVVRDTACPACSKPLRARGTDIRIASHSTYEADAACADCGALVGILVAEISTLFGLEEDEAVLIRGRARVY